MAAQAHGIHPIWVVAALSPVPVLLLTVLLGWLTRSVRLGILHGGVVIVWVIWFWVASSLVTNDYVIWAPLAAYLLHSAIILGLVARYAVKRITRKGSAVTQQVSREIK